ncbi:MAG: hypothetical protein PHE38_16140 [Alishewanella agri]|nr:hypothetical protein [Alishewanella agri]
MKSLLSLTAALILLQLLTACGPASAENQLPLRLGFYVAADTPCANASNATLLLLRANGIGGARDFCQFLSIRQLSAQDFLVTESCADFQASEAEQRLVRYQIIDAVSFKLSRVTAEQPVLSQPTETEVFYQGYYCPQSSLPEPWRDNDLSDLGINIKP